MVHADLADPPVKRARTDDVTTADAPDAPDAVWQPTPEAVSDPSSVVNASLLSPTSTGHLRELYDSSGPYPHCVLRDVFDSTLLRAVRDEIVQNVQVFQTGDLGNLDALDAESSSRLPALTTLKAALYSPRFRNFVRQVTGCGELSNQTDCSCNVYPQGGHLLCHDDVIGTRCISYIIYLTDPDSTWEERDGGALELYPLEAGACQPSCIPSTLLLPFWNSMACFTVLPGRSFHAIQEVATSSKPRMSISGWYHAAAAPPDAQRASLQQLQLRAGEDADAVVFTAFDGGAHEVGEEDLGELGDDDLALLVRYVNPTYLSPESWQKIRTRFQADGSVQLQSFLRTPLASRITAAATREDLADRLGAAAAGASVTGQAPPSGDATGTGPSTSSVGERDAEEEEGEASAPPSDYAAGVRDGWQLVGPPHKQRYARLDVSSSGSAGTSAPAGAAASKGDAAGGLLDQVRCNLLQTPAFRRLLRRLTSLDMTGYSGEVRRFRPGLDYTVAHYGILTRDPRLDAVLCFVNDAHPDAAAAWDMGEVGGFEAYLLAEEDEAGNVAADVYRKDAEESGVLNVSAACNSLNLVLRDEGLMRFVKFVSARAPGSRWDVAMEYQPEPDSDDEDGAAGTTAQEQAAEEEAAAA